MHIVKINLSRKDVKNLFGCNGTNITKNMSGMLKYFCEKEPLSFEISTPLALPIRIGALMAGFFDSIYKALTGITEIFNNPSDMPLSSLQQLLLSE